MLDHTGKVLITERLEIKIAESSQKALILWKKSSLEIFKVGAISTNKKTILSNSFGRAKAGVKYRDSVFL